MFAHRLRAARDRGLDLALKKLLPSGSLGPSLDDPAAMHSLPLALAAAGHLAAARRVLDRVALRYVSHDGDVRASQSLRSADGDCAESPTRMPSRLALGALRAGRASVATRLDAWLQSVPSAGGGVSIQGPRAGETATDFAATLHVGALDLAFARRPQIADRARWITAQWAAQPHADALLLRRDASGSLVTLWPASSASSHAIHALGPGSGHGVLGESLAWMSEALPLAPKDLHDALLRTAQGIMGFAARAEAHVRRPVDQASLAMGAALFARALRVANARDDHDAADLAVRLALRVCEAWRPDGFGADSGERPLTRVDDAAWIAYCLHETLASLDVTEPVSDREPPPGWRVVLCNVPELKAQEIADALVSERLAACVNAINPVRSTYVWKAKVEREAEVTLLIKTTADRMTALTARIRAMHPYELPEVIALAVESSEGHLPYLDWVRSQVTPDDEAPKMPPAS